MNRLIGLDYLMAGYFHLAAMDIKCRAREMPSVTVAVSDTRVRYDHTKTRKQLDNFDYDTISPYDGNAQAHVAGLMNGEFSMSQNVRIMQEAYPYKKAGCLHIDAVEVKIHIKPVIYIAKEYPRSGCLYNAILEHEKKHLAVDQRIVAKYSLLIKQGVKENFRRSGVTFGPYSIGSLNGAQKGIHESLQAFIKGYSNRMSEERARAQQELDTLAEYEPVQAVCRPTY